MRYRRHVFVCTNTRPEGGKPACAGAPIVAALQRAIAQDANLVGSAAATPCGCLGPCFDGPNLVIYPEGEWLSHVQLTDIDAIVSYLRGAPGSIDHLRYEWPADE